MKRNHIKTLFRLVLFLMIGVSILSANYAQTPPSPTAQATETAPDGTPTTPDENSTPVQNSDDSAYLATLERLTNLLVIIVTGGAVVGTGALGLTLRTLIQLAKTLAALTPSTVDDEFIKRVVDKIEGK